MNLNEYAIFKLKVNNNCFLRKVDFNDSDKIRYFEGNENKYISMPYSNFKVVGFRVYNNVNYFELECISKIELGNLNDVVLSSLFSY